MDGDLFLIVLTSSGKLETEVTTQSLFLVVFAVHIPHQRDPKQGMQAASEGDKLLHAGIG